MADELKGHLWLPVDYISFMNRGYYDIVLDTCTDLQTGAVDLFPINEPFFQSKQDGSVLILQASQQD